jgi:hypothetical protein
MSHDVEDSRLVSSPSTCERCGCDRNRPCRIEIIVSHSNGNRSTLLEDQCDWSAPGLCTTCDERLLPELRSLIEVWRQLGAIAMVYRTV